MGIVSAGGVLAGGVAPGGGVLAAGGGVGALLGGVEAPGRAAVVSTLPGGVWVRAVSGETAPVSGPG
jgi:hypothetical protein